MHRENIKSEKMKRKCSSSRNQKVYHSFFLSSNTFIKLRLASVNYNSHLTNDSNRYTRKRKRYGGLIEVSVVKIYEGTQIQAIRLQVCYMLFFIVHAKHLLRLLLSICACMNNLIDTRNSIVIVRDRAERNTYKKYFYAI